MTWERWAEVSTQPRGIWERSRMAGHSGAFCKCSMTWILLLLPHFLNSSASSAGKGMWVPGSSSFPVAALSPCLLEVCPELRSWPPHWKTALVGRRYLSKEHQAWWHSPVSLVIWEVGKRILVQGPPGLQSEFKGRLSYRVSFKVCPGCRVSSRPARAIEFVQSLLEL